MHNTPLNIDQNDLLHARVLMQLRKIFKDLFTGNDTKTYEFYMASKSELIAWMSLKASKGIKRLSKVE